MQVTTLQPMRASSPLIQTTRRSDNCFVEHRRKAKDMESWMDSANVTPPPSAQQTTIQVHSCSRLRKSDSRSDRREDATCTFDKTCKSGCAVGRTEVGGPSASIELQSTRQRIAFMSYSPTKRYERPSVQVPSRCQCHSGASVLSDDKLWRR